MDFACATDRKVHSSPRDIPYCLNKMTILINFLLVVYVIVCVLLVLSVLMQRPKSEGLGTAFGSGFTENILGAGASEFLVKVTSYFGAFFFILSFVLAYLYAHQNTGTTAVEKKLLSTPVPAISVPATNSQAATPAEGVQNPSPATASPAASAPKSDNSSH